MIKKAIVFLYSVIVVVLAVATFVENSYGTRFVTENVYHTAWFCALWAALAVLSVVLLLSEAYGGEFRLHCCMPRSSLFLLAR